jgi:hypothetical protein
MAPLSQKLEPPKIPGRFNAPQYEGREAAARGRECWQVKGVEMSDCIHCQIHDLLESHLQNPEANVADIAFKVTEVLADLILMASPENQGMLIADILRNLGQLVLEKNGEAEDEGQSGRRRH